ncbi:histidine kinase [Amycolatopsis jejuensis]|uniref:histidine kinase n=1 Tax=Amycolatopsis jejuensis TaxID=330084 RepID=UPI0006911931|nr:histidine kinase [Amycolatopsis jejuensis]
MRRFFEWTGARPLATDVLIVVVLGGFSVLSVLFSREKQWAIAVLGVVLVAPVFVRRKAPVAAMLVSLGTLLVQILLPLPLAGKMMPANLALAVVIYSVVLHGRAVVTWGGVVAAEVLFVFWAGDLGSTIWLILFLMLTGILIAAVAMGEAASIRLQQLADARAHARDAEERRDALARAAVAEERTRIAREMHDIVAHAVATMVMQSEGARLLGARDPVAVDAALRTIGVTGRTAITELRSILGVLREAETGTAPQPTVDTLDELVTQVRAAGLEAELTVKGDTADVPPGAAMTAHRIVQEALTNVLKHAPVGARCTVTADYGNSGARGREILIEVRNDGGRPAESRGPGDEVRSVGAGGGADAGDSGDGVRSVGAGYGTDAGDSGDGMSSVGASSEPEAGDSRDGMRSVGAGGGPGVGGLGEGAPSAGGADGGSSGPDVPEINGDGARVAEVDGSAAEMRRPAGAGGGTRPEDLVGAEDRVRELGVGDDRSPGLRSGEGTGGQARQAGPAGSGYGIAGMRERALMFGGSFVAEGQVGGGFVVAARFPFPDGKEAR